MTTTPLLQAHDLETCYGDAQALFGASLTVAEGEFVTLLGRNGMGKTTTCLLYTSPSPRDAHESRMPSSA